MADAPPGLPRHGRGAEGSGSRRAGVRKKHPSEEGNSWADRQTGSRSAESDQRPDAVGERRSSAAGQRADASPKDERGPTRTQGATGVPLR